MLESVSHYQILGKLGEGGMGEVYKAEDSHLKRVVALKVMPGEVAADPAHARRFQREAEAVARLNHPNIVTIYSIEESDGLRFITLELVEGKTLADLIPAGGVDLETFFEISLPLAEAVAFAHEHGITHRDLKPANIMVTPDGRVKVLDFGLAKLRSELLDAEASLAGPQTAVEPRTLPPTLTQVTQAGTLLGTVPYMSPEQLQDGAVDHRADIFSLGIILYEMATGRRPFSSTSSIGVISAILQDTPSPLSEIREDLPGPLIQIVEGCLQKDPNRRSQSARDVRNQLASLQTKLLNGSYPLTPVSLPARASGRSKRWAVAATVVVVLALGAVSAYRAAWGPVETAAKKGPATLKNGTAPGELVARRVVVIPFENRTGSDELDTVGLMATDWLTQGLSRSGRVEIVPTDLALRITRSAVESGAVAEGAGLIETVARETAAGTVISGAYYREGEALLLNAQVTDVIGSRVVSAIDPVRTPLGNTTEGLETLRQRIMPAIATLIDPELAQMASLVSHPPSFEAYESYVVGMERYNSMDFRGSIEPLKRAASSDPGYVTPLLMAATAHYNLGQYGDLDQYDEAEKLLAEVEPMREQLAPLDGYHLDWMSAECRGDRAGALRAARKAAELAPQSQWAFRYGVFALMVNRPREGNAAMAALDPNRGFFKGWLPYVLHYTSSFHLMGDHESELRETRRARQIFPESLGALGLEARALAALGRAEEVETLLAEAVTHAPEFMETPGSVMMLAARELRAHGQPEAADAAAHRSVRWHENLPPSQRSETTNRVNLARVLLDLGELDRAAALFEELAEKSPENLDYMGSLAVIAARRGDRAVVDRAEDELRTLDRPHLFGEPFYWRAAIAAWDNRPDEAISLLRAAYARGRTFYWDPQESPHVDPLMEPLWQHPDHIELIRPRG